MKLEYSNLAEWGKASRKIKQRRGSYYWGTPSKDDLAGWQLQMFTADKESKAESKRNLAALKQKAQEVEAPVLVLRSNDVQLIGTQLSLTTNDLVDDEWMDSLGEYFDNRNYYFSKP